MLDSLPRLLSCALLLLMTLGTPNQASLSSVFENLLCHSAKVLGFGRASPISLII